LLLFLLLVLLLLSDAPAAVADLSNYSAWHYRTLLLPRLHNEDITTGVSKGSVSGLRARQQ
jgi:hypothetical protein